VKAPVAHINLLQRTAPAHTVAWSMAGLFTLALLGSLYYGNHLWGQAREARRVRDDVALQLKAVKERMAVATGEQAKSAQSVALRKEIDALQPQSLVAQTLLDAVRSESNGRTGDFTRVLSAMTGLNEPGLWLTTLTVSNAGKRLELQGGAGDGASVLRYASRANESLRPLAMRLDSLEVQPSTTAAAAAAGPGGAVSFRLY
jgi:hypothetical protein